MAKDNIILNSIFLKNRVTELGLKQWWLAEQVAVDRKTVLRWLHGKVKTIQLENAQALVEKARGNDKEHLTAVEAANIQFHQLSTDDKSCCIESLNKLS